MSEEQKNKCPFSGFVPPYPKPNKNKTSLAKRFSKGLNSWLHILFEKSYSMKLGHVKLPKADVYMPCEPSLVKRVLKDEAQDFPKHKEIQNVLKPLFGNGIFVTNGEVWERQRKMMSPAFTYTGLKKVFPQMDNSIKKLIERFENFDTGKLVHIDVEMTHVTADIIFQTILSHPLEGTEALEVYKAFNDFQKHSQKLAIMSMYRLPTFFQKRKNEAAGKRIESILSKILKVRYNEFQKTKKDSYNDILSALLNAKDDLGNNFNYEELKDQIMGFFLAGHETSASATTWALYLIASCKETQNKILNEVNDVCGNDNVKFEDLKKLIHTDNSFKESLRLYPPIGFLLREASKDVEMRKKKIKKGAMMMISPWLIHRHRDQWKEPDMFCPARFSSNSSEAKESIKSSYLPFGKGPRICIGAGFATQESVMILANLVKNFELETSPDHVPEPVGRVTIRPKDGVWLKIKKRKK